jgi:hypothetical protein
LATPVSLLKGEVAGWSIKTRIAAEMVVGVLAMGWFKCCPAAL